MRPAPRPSSAARFRTLPCFLGGHRKHIPKHESCQTSEQSGYANTPLAKANTD